ncbi:Metallo-hydrolase/oxidoreductase [Hyaloscypha variabilis F]|uniref:Metallo-hydrolase/oxidoreductase n=1 Tax=Hyaloscypha variabilis (strain UAMH 11265 / GT02V1 / F) TaxID=1149755 RepID=A0A2J6SDV9_HYAVF|nr:Metallo-hydrolase/oxidoreductase [Hyaloscypha variabilis F]
MPASHLLNLGFLEADSGFFVRGGNASTASNLHPEPTRRKLAMISVLISHPTEGLMLFETGAGKEYIWGEQLNDIFARVDYRPEHELENAIAKTGHSINDVKTVIMGHLHLDHAGGLENFVGTGVPICVHEVELKHAYYSVATKADLGVYLPKNLRWELNWQPVHGSSWDIAEGITIRHAPGHTPGLCILQINLRESGTWIFTTDQYHVKENFCDSVPQGWLARDHSEWVRTHQMIRSMAKHTNAKLVFGHCKETLDLYKQAPECYM